MHYWGITDPGCTRPQNQDTYLVEALDKHNLLCVVCDGMGGAKSGNVASTLAADVFVQEVKRSWTADMDQEAAAQMLCSAVKLANFTVHDQAGQFEEFSGMGTTLVAVLIQGQSLLHSDQRGNLADHPGSFSGADDDPAGGADPGTGKELSRQESYYPSHRHRACGELRCVSAQTVRWRLSASLQ